MLRNRGPEAKLGLDWGGDMYLQSWLRHFLIYRDLMGKRLRLPLEIFFQRERHSPLGDDQLKFLRDKRWCMALGG